MAESIGFLGPGLMGRGVMKNLLGKGYKVMVHAHKEAPKAKPAAKPVTKPHVKPAAKPAAKAKAKKR